MGYKMQECIDSGEDFYIWTDEMIEGLAKEESIIDLTVKGEEIKKRIEIVIPEGYQFVDENGDIINATKIVLEKKKKEYPKTYEVCWYELKHDINYDKVEGYKSDILSALQKLLICRDAYWKMAGEEMGLGKPWEPTKGEMVYSIYRHSNKIETEMFLGKSVTFEFPTPEMRDAFKENFDTDLEFCKEFL